MPAAWLRDAGTAKGQRMQSPPALRGQAGPRVLTSVLKNVMEDFKIWLLSNPKKPVHQVFRLFTVICYVEYNVLYFEVENHVQIKV